MIQFYGVFVCQVFEQLGISIASLGTDNRELGSAYKESMSRLSAFDTIEQHKHIFLDDDLSSRIWGLRQQLKGNEPFTAASLARDLQGILGQMKISLVKRKFTYIPPPNDEYLEQERPFGEEVYSSFEDARIDIKDASNCFAASLYTACVFHLTRVVEFGLRALARKLRVRITSKGQFCPLEFGEWDKVITAIKNKIDAVRKLPAGPKRQAQLEYYSDAADHCTFMKDIWRNNISHARKPYKDAEALAVFGRVRDFMKFLAQYLAEQSL